MPVTPFHFGPGAALHAVAPKHVSFLAFCAANILIDLESLYNLRTDILPAEHNARALARAVADFFRDAGRQTLDVS